jgi:flagellar hook protein FlgE
MSVTSALFAGATGVSAMSKSMQVVSNNIANINTVGFKGSRTEFADLLSQAINTPGGKKQIGRGVRVQSIQGMFHQGSFETTPVVTDVAINGSGYFKLITDEQDIFYSRAGQFRIDKEGNLVNSLGMNVQGYIYDNAGNQTQDIDNINLTSATAPPNPTGDGVADDSGIFMNINFDATGEINTFNLANPEGTSNYSTAVTVYDSIGVPHTVTMYFNRTTIANQGGATNSTWEWHGVVDGAELQGGTPGVLEEEASGTMVFDTSGQMTSYTTTASNFNFAGGAAQNQTIGFDFTGSSQVGLDPSVTNSITQDGYSSGFLQSIDISRDGVITGVFSNGIARDLARFALATFPAETELFRTGDSLFIETPESGQANLGEANLGRNGSIAASTLELSNVDLTRQFISMITTQRSFQANTKIISTGDEMLETVINMKR